MLHLIFNNCISSLIYLAQTQFIYKLLACNVTTFHENRPNLFVVECAHEFQRDRPRDGRPAETVVDQITKKKRIQDNITERILLFSLWRNCYASTCYYNVTNGHYTKRYVNSLSNVWFTSILMLPIQIQSNKNANL